MRLVFKLFLMGLLLSMGLLARADDSGGADEIGESELCRLCNFHPPDIKSRLSDMRKARLFPHIGNSEVEGNSNTGDTPANQ